MNLLSAMEDPALFGPWFSSDSWASWRTFLKALFGLPMDAHERHLYQQCTRRSNAPREQAREAWLVIGRRGGKSFITALIAVYLSTFRDYFVYLAPGERGTFMIIASDRKQARVVRRYILGLLENIPLLSNMIERVTAEAVDLSNRISIEIHTSSYRGVRGYTLVGCVLDELAFWRSEESASPDTEVINALKPGMMTIPGALMLCISSPYSRRGALWEAYKKHFEKDGPTLIWKADTKTMNPTVDSHLINQAYDEDLARAAAEYGAEFRSDLEDFITREVVEACVIPQRYELPFAPDMPYRAFCDPSGGSSDSFTVAIAHPEGDRVVLDAIRERSPPFSPDAVVEEFSKLIKSYGLAEVSGDRYAGEWPRERFQLYGVYYRTSEKTKSELYGALLSLLNAG